ncbi:MAG: hypothetical protein JO253_03010 [Alphaproteobacteria bacterium]|nr:hypothetical protein [Alphaproteobacteria bacterium]
MEISASYSIQRGTDKCQKGVMFVFTDGSAMERFVGGKELFYTKASIRDRRTLNPKQSAKRIEEMKAAAAKRFAA